MLVFFNGKNFIRKMGIFIMVKLIKYDYNTLEIIQEYSKKIDSDDFKINFTDY